MIKFLIIIFLCTCFSFQSIASNMYTSKFIASIKSISKDIKKNIYKAQFFLRPTPYNVSINHMEILNCLKKGIKTNNFLVIKYIDDTKEILSCNNYKK